LTLWGEEEEENAIGYPNRDASYHLTLEGGGSLPAINTDKHEHE